MSSRTLAFGVISGSLALGAIAGLAQVVEVTQVAPAQAVTTVTSTVVATVKAVGPQSRPAAAPALPASAASQQPTVATAEDEQISGPLEAIRDGKLIVGSQPKRAIPLADVQLVTIPARTSPNGPATPSDAVVQKSLAAAWLGQDGHDLVGTSPNPAPNGIQDVHIRISGLPPAATIRQATITSSPDPGEHPGKWQFGFPGEDHWAIAVEREAGSETADLYFEPLRDLFQHDLSVQVSYDGPGLSTSVGIGFRAASHTNPALKLIPAVQPAPAAPSATTLHLEEGDLLNGQILKLGGDTVQLRSPGRKDLSVPLVQLLGIRFGSSAAAATELEQFSAELKTPHTDDVALVQTAEGVTKIAGRVRALEEGKLRFEYQGKTRSIGLRRLKGLIFATHPPVRQPGAMLHVFHLAGGEQISGAWTAVSSTGFELRTPWDQPLALAAATVSSIGIRNGRVTFLSDLEPSSVEEAPYFDRVMHFQRDHNLSGDPLKVAGKVYGKGLAVHSRCVLRYALNGGYARFKTVLGFDDPGGKQGRAECRVLADGRPLFARADARGDQPPAPLDLPVAGVQELTLEVDFGAAEDTADRVIWANARLFK